MHYNCHIITKYFLNCLEKRSYKIRGTIFSNEANVFIPDTDSKLDTPLRQFFWTFLEPYLLWRGNDGICLYVQNT